MMASKVNVGSTRALATRPSLAGARRVIARAEAGEKTKSAIDSMNQVVNEAAAEASKNDPKLMGETPPSGVTDMADKLNVDAPSQPQEFNLFTRTQELINGRAAMVGFLAAIGSEVLSHQATLYQITGKVADGEVVQRAQGSSWLLWGAVITTLTLASLAPRLFQNEQPEDREYSIWQASAEMLNGRVAMLGFLALLATEAVTGSALF